MFPSLINCCTIDWFQTWPTDALEMVANKFLEDVELEDHIRKEYEFICQETYKANVYFPSPFTPNIVDQEAVIRNEQSQFWDFSASQRDIDKCI